MIPTLWNVSEPLCDNGVFKTPGNLKNKNLWLLFQSSMLQYRQRPQEGRHPKDILDSERSLPPLWGFVGLRGEKSMHHEILASRETWLESAFH